MNSQLLWILIGVQIAMGAFDTIYHHELTERLAWRESQRHELRLHAVRNFLYALVFAALGFAELHGVWAVLAIAVLGTEVLITLMDFVEEDMTRKLPVSERINHTLLALNYGAILALVLPVLVDWVGRPNGIVASTHGAWSCLAAIAACGVGVLGLRDLAAARRWQRLCRRPAETLTGALARRHSVLVTGGTGFIGRRLIEALAAGGHDVTVLVRDPHKAATLRPPLRIITHLDQIPTSAVFHTIVNLAGEPTADGLWTRRKRHRITVSRIRMTRDLVRLIARLAQPPAVLISGSAVGWYGLRRDEALTETSGEMPCFTQQVCDAWERAATAAEAYGVRVVRLRIGLVLGTDGGLLARLLPLFEFGLGSRLGSGRQWMSWIERDDLVRLIVHAIVHPELAGPVNATAPHPIRHADFVGELARALHRPLLLRTPAALLRALGGDLAGELLLGGQRVVPERALASGFRFRHDTVQSAFAELLAPQERASRAGTYGVADAGR